jgi:hypothetical protein
MIGLWRPLVTAAVLSTTAGAGWASAQTIIVKKATPGASVQATFNAGAPVTATAEPDGIARVPLTLVSGDDETVVRVYFDRCDTRIRVALTGRDIEPPNPDTACTRRDLSGVFVLRRATTLVIDASETVPTILISQGPPPPEWLLEGDLSLLVIRNAPVGIMAYGSLGITRMTDTVQTFCGSNTTCAGSNIRPSFSGGVTWWIARFMAAEAGYAAPMDVHAEGTGDAFVFDSRLEAEYFTVAGKVGLPVRQFRPYFTAGGNWHRSTSTTEQITDDIVRTIDGAQVTFPGGTHTVAFRTEGWGWLFGGGLEAWVTDRTAIFVDFRTSKLKGPNVDGGEGGIDKQITSYEFGVRFNLTP